MQVYFDSQISLLQTDGGISSYFKKLQQTLTSQSPQLNVTTSKQRSRLAGRFRVASGLWSFGERFPGGTDLYHPTYYGSQWARHPRLQKAKMVVTIFDMIPEEEMAPWHRNPHFFKLTYMQKADLILTSSESTARKIENLGLEATVIPLASPLSAPPKDAQSKVNRTGLLYVGRRTGYKNFAGLLRVLALTEPTIHLTVFGGGPSTHAERALVASLGLGERVIWSELSSSDHLRSLYLSSAVHVIPSKREGFGLTQLEAMQHGCVNFLNEIPVFREVSGESAVYSDFDDPHESAYKLQSLYFDTNRLQKIRESGLVHERNFTWERVAAETLSAYRRVINS